MKHTRRPLAFLTFAVLTAGCDPSSTPPRADEPASPAASVSAPSASAAASALAVYYLGTERHWREADGQPVDRLKLYRELHRLPAGDGGPEARTIAAVSAMLDPSSVLDPDYRTGWPPGARVLHVAVEGDTVTVDVGGAGTNNVGAEAAQQAVQQLVWTATAASGKAGVRLLLDGAAAHDLWGHVSAAGVLRRAPAFDTVGLVWLIDPQHGTTTAKTFTVHVSASVFESTVQLRARQGDRTVLERFVTVAGATGGRFGEAKTTLTLPAGTYVVEAYSQSSVDGRPMFLDDHTITVR
jgi:hypothetical protein